MTYDCMTPAELALWRASGQRVPCIDCPLWFAAERRAEGCCDGTPRTADRRHPSGASSSRYATPQERIAARRQTWRESKRRSLARARATWDNDAAGTSGPQVDSNADAVPSASPRRSGVAVSLRQGLDA